MLNGVEDRVRRCRPTNRCRESAFQQASQVMLTTVPQQSLGFKRGASLRPYPFQT